MNKLLSFSFLLLLLLCFLRCLCFLHICIHLLALTVVLYGRLCVHRSSFFFLDRRKNVFFFSFFYHIYLHGTVLVSHKIYCERVRASSSVSNENLFNNTFSKEFNNYHIPLNRKYMNMYWTSSSNYVLSIWNTSNLRFSYRFSEFQFGTSIAGFWSHTLHACLHIFAFSDCVQFFLKLLSSLTCIFVLVLLLMRCMPYPTAHAFQFQSSRISFISFTPFSSNGISWNIEFSILSFYCMCPLIYSFLTYIKYVLKNPYM